MSDQGANHPLREAARILGVSVPTLRRRIRAGELQAVLRPGPFGEQWEVPEAELASWTGTRRGLPRPLPEPDQMRDLGMIEGEDPDPGSTAERWALERAGYWRGRWEELREVLHSVRRETPEAAEAAAAPEPDEDVESLREALRHKSQELVQARNLVDSLRREKARLESELQALRGRPRASGEVTLSEVEVSRARLPRL